MVTPYFHAQYKIKAFTVGGGRGNVMYHNVVTEDAVLVLDPSTQSCMCGKLKVTSSAERIGLYCMPLNC